MAHIGNKSWEERTESFSATIRERLYDHIKPMLAEADQIHDSRSRSVIQACCLDVVSAIEELIDEYELGRVA